jgi:hypothetical protein
MPFHQLTGEDRVERVLPSALRVFVGPSLPRDQRLVIAIFASSQSTSLHLRESSSEKRNAVAAQFSTRMRCRDVRQVLDDNESLLRGNQNRPVAGRAACFDRQQGGFW